MNESFDPEQDIDCTRCHTTVDWGDDRHIGVPEDPDDRICHDCAWKELVELRKYKNGWEEKLSKIQVQEYKTGEPDKSKWNSGIVRIFGLAPVVFSSERLTFLDSKELALNVRRFLGILAQHVEEELRGPVTSVNEDNTGGMFDPLLISDLEKERKS